MIVISFTQPPPPHTHTNKKTYPHNTSTNSICMVSQPYSKHKMKTNTTILTLQESRTKYKHMPKLRKKTLHQVQILFPPICPQQPQQCPSTNTSCHTRGTKIHDIMTPKPLQESTNRKYKTSIDITCTNGTPHKAPQHNGERKRNYSTHTTSSYNTTNFF